MSVQDPSRRAFVKKAAYVAPVIVTLAAAPAYARLGSDRLPPRRPPRPPITPPRPPFNPPGPPPWVPGPPRP